MFVMAAIESMSTFIPQLIGGSADLSGSNNTKTKIQKIINSKNFNGNYITLWCERTWYGCNYEWS